MTAKKRNSQHQQKVGHSGSTSSQSSLMGFSYAILDKTFQVNPSYLPFAPQESFGDYITWSSPITIGDTTSYSQFSLKAGYFYSIFYRAFIQSNDPMYDPNLGIMRNGNFISSSLIAAPAVTNKPVLLRNNIIISAENSNDYYELYTLSTTTVTSEGLNAGEDIAMDPASITITVIGEASTMNQATVSQNTATKA